LNKTRVTSIRLDLDLLEKAAAFGINVSRFCEYTLRREVNRRLLDLGVVPVGTAGISRKSRIIMADERFKEISKIKVGEGVISYNPATDRVEDANVIDVGPLTSEDTFATTITIENGAGTGIEVLPDTRIFCWQDSYSKADWLPAKDIRAGYFVTVASHKSYAGGSTRIERTVKNHVRDIFLKLEVYPNNSFFANSNPRRKMRYFEDYPASVWAFPIKGYLGKIGVMLEESQIF